MHQWDKSRVWQLIARKLAGEASQDNLTELNELIARHPEIQDYFDIISEWWEVTERMGKEDADLLIKELMTQIEHYMKTSGDDRKKGFRFFSYMTA